MTKAEQLRQRQEWDELLAAFHASDLSAPKWCDANGIKLHQLRYRLGVEKTGKTGEPGPTVWLKTTIGGAALSGTGLRVRIGQAVIEIGHGFDPEILAAVARALLGAC